ncbi:MAG: M14 family zinc carboxypeptidase, partial [bacterium]
MAGNDVDMLIVTNFSSIPEDIAVRKAIILTSRVHPGESNASWMMKGCIDFLLSDKEEACQLRRKFVFKIVPMLCPDGVINGNYRCGIAGHDMNRRWAKPHPKQHSPIFHMKLMIEEMMEERQVVLFCD